VAFTKLNPPYIINQTQSTQNIYSYSIMASRTFTYNNHEFEINSLGQLILEFPMKLTLADFNNIFDLEIVKNTVKELQIHNFYSLKTIPANLFNLTNLRTLSILKCNILVLPEAIGNLTNLLQLYLQDNKVKNLPESLATIHDLRLLYLERNPLEASKKNIDILTAIYNNGSKPIIRVDDGFGGLDLVTERKYKTGTLKGKPYKTNILLKSDFDILHSKPSVVSHGRRTTTARSNRTQRSRSSSTRSRSSSTRSNRSPKK
jgi:Leucine-rich repeat (LRR) protein